MDLVLVRNSLALNMGRNATIRRAVNDVEDIVKKHSVAGYAQPQVLPVPDELGPEIPRMIFSAREGHSQILVSQVGVTFNVNYSPDWGADPDKCRAYLLSKVAMLFEIASAGWKGSMPVFSGVTTAFLLKTASVADSVQMLAPRFTDSAMLIETANELSYRWSLSVDSKFYNNIVVQTTSLLKGPSETVDSIPRFNDKTIEGYGVEVVGDYNDRLAYNSNVDFVSDAANAEAMINASFESTLKAVNSISRSDA